MDKNKTCTKFNENEIQNTNKLTLLYDKNPVNYMEYIGNMLDKVHISSIDNPDGSLILKNN